MVEFIYFDSSDALPAFMAIAIPAGILVCPNPVTEMQLRRIIVNGINLTDLISLKINFD